MDIKDPLVYTMAAMPLIPRAKPIGTRSKMRKAKPPNKIKATMLVSGIILSSFLFLRPVAEALDDNDRQPNT